MFAFFGILMPSASSTERTEASACTPVHTPQMRSTNAHASRGSRPLRITSRPRHIVPGGHRVADHVVLVDVDLDAQVALDAGDRVDDDALAAVVELEALGLDDGHDHFSTSDSLSLRVLLRACLIALTAACAATAAPATATAVRPMRSAVPSMPSPPGALIVVRWS